MLGVAAGESRGRVVPGRLGVRMGEVAVSGGGVHRRTRGVGGEDWWLPQFPEIQYTELIRLNTKTLLANGPTGRR